MGLLGMGVQEIVIIAIVALIIFGPDRLPELAGQAGKLLRDARRMTSDLQGEFEREAGVNVRELRSQVDREIAGVKGELTGATNTLQKEVNSAKRTAQSAASSANKTGSKATAAKTSSTSSTSATSKTSSVSTAKTTGAATKTAKVEEVKPIASKSDPLADVSFMDNTGEAPKVKAAASNGTSTATSASATGGADRSDAVQRARNRRLQAGYNQPR
ncbi:MAG: twin-arginine translocase TatA/TatE family subunit [Thermomicrobiales bacterium]|nr:MAG: twin-arginine translocase TatA/TatE family subunit [Thermomicrobiales bacterium]